MSAIISLLADATGAVSIGAGAACSTACNTNSTVGSIFANVASVLVFLVGAISIIMIIIGALRYVLSNGDSKAAGDAKNTILYAVVGLVVSVAAYAIEKFVVGAIK